MRDQLADDVSKKCKNSNKVKNNDPVDAQAEAGSNSFEIEYERLSLKANKIKLKSLILAQIERWRHA